VAVIVAVLAFARPASAGAKEDLEKAEQLYANLDYDAANKLAASVVKQRGLTHDQLVRGYRILAISHAVLDREEPARDAFVMLLTYDSEYQADPNLGPRVTTPFFEARGFWRGQSTKPGVDVVATAKAHEASSLKVTIRDPSHIVKRAQAAYRWGPTGDFTVKPVATGEAATLDVPEPPANASRLDYYVQAFDDKDNAVLETGNATQPKTVTVEAGPAAATPPADKKKSVFSSPVFWVVTTGVVVVGGGLAAFLLTRPAAEPTSASLSPALTCGGVKCN